MNLITDVAITQQNLLSGRLDAYGAEVFRVPNQSDYCIRICDDVVVVSLDENEVCNFRVEDHAPMPVYFIDTIQHEFNCACYPDLTSLGADALAEWMTRQMKSADPEHAVPDAPPIASTATDYGGNGAAQWDVAYSQDDPPMDVLVSGPPAVKKWIEELFAGLASDRGDKQKGD
jgi:hypothetical protein